MWNGLLRLVRTFTLSFDFRILAIDILTLKVVVVIWNTFKSLISIKSFTNYCDYYKNIYLYYELCTKTNIKSVRMQNLENKIWEEYSKQKSSYLFLFVSFKIKNYIQKWNNLKKKLGEVVSFLIFEIHVVTHFQII